MDATQTQQAIMYRGWIIEPSDAYIGGYNFWPANEGKNIDYDYDDGHWINCGNVHHTMDIEDAKDEIWEITMMERPQHKVVMNKCDYYFEWIEDAIKFAVQWNAEEFHPGITA